MAITVPDLNQVLAQMNGRVLPLGWWKFLTKGRRIDRVRVGFLGVKPEYQHTGVAAKLYEEHYNAAERHAAERRRDGLDPRDEHRDEPRHGSDGGTVVKRYRVYERVLDPAAAGAGEQAGAVSAESVARRPHGRRRHGVGV